jgi:hypothetical protein
MLEVSIDVIDRSVYYLAYFLSPIFKLGLDLVKTRFYLSSSYTRVRSCFSVFCLFETAFHVGPVDYVPPFVDVCASIVLVLQIVSMFPNIENQ